ncbi:MAG: tyrosine-type recombinase/integrase [Pseudomonadota bacterium]
MGRNRKKDKHLPKNVYMRSGGYYFVDYEGKWHNLGRNFALAMQKYGLLADARHCETMSEVIDRYLREIAPLKAESTYKDNIKQSKYLRAAFGRMRPVQVTPKMVYQYMDERGKNSQVQANREIALLSHMFKKAIRWGFVSTNPVKGIERFKEKPRERYVTDEEFNAFKDFAGPEIAAYLDFKLLTGLRKGDILRLKRSDIQDDGIHAYISKTRKTIVIEWTDALRDAVDAILNLKKPIYSISLFRTRRGQPYSVDGFNSIWQRKMRKALEEGVLKERFTDHDIRAKTGSDTSEAHAVELLAHDDPRTTKKHYRRKDSVVRPLK